MAGATPAIPPPAAPTWPLCPPAPHSLLKKPAQQFFPRGVYGPQSFTAVRPLAGKKAYPPPPAPPSPPPPKA